MARKTKYERNYEIETKNDRLNWIGKVFKSNECGRFEVIGVYDKNKYYAKRYICKFIDTGFETITEGSNIKRGVVRDKYFKSYYGAAYIGDYEKSARKHPFYTTWSNMLRRAYSEEYMNKFPTYKDTTICDRWLCFTSFINDMKYITGHDEMMEFKYIDFEIDKDILVHGNKEYSLDKCCFIPKKLNYFFINRQSTNVTGFEGVTYFAGKIEANVSANNKNRFLGYFDNELDAYLAYYNEKRNILDFYLQYEFSFLDVRIKNAMRKKLQTQFNEAIQRNERRVAQYG